MTNPLSLYIHWPFCRSKCPYCDFNSHVSDHIDETAWTKAYCRGLEYYANKTSARPLTSIFFGGGTPSLMPARMVEEILSHIAKYWTMANDIEITIEANPTSVESHSFQSFRAAGVNRVSIGLQSLRSQDLKFLGREHSVSEAKLAIDIASRNFDRFSFDLIYGRPGQSLDDWIAELDEALSMAPNHISLYQLTIEKGTAFHKAGIKALEPDAAATQFTETRAYLASKGLPAYEISNHAKEGEACRHNLGYWRGDDFLGVGPGAHGRIRQSQKPEREATLEHRSPDRWLKAVTETGNGLHHVTTIQRSEAMAEDLMMGLRLSEGVSRARFEGRYRQKLEHALDKKSLKACVNEGLVEIDTETLRVTEHGMVLLDQIVAEVLSDDLV